MSSRNSSAGEKSDSRDRRAFPGSSGTGGGRKFKYNRFERQEKAFRDNAKKLRGYRKAAKQEGFEAGRGGSRKRKREKESEKGDLGEEEFDGDGDRDGDEGGLAEDVASSMGKFAEFFKPDYSDINSRKMQKSRDDCYSDEGNDDNDRRGQRISLKERKKLTKKGVMFAKEKKQADLLREEKRRKQEEIERKVLENKRKVKERRRMSKQMGRRTAKGQVVMKSVIGNLLSKIEKTTTSTSTSTSTST